MPYKLRKAPGKELYWVVNKETGKKHSKDPISKEDAKAQMKALYAVESGYTLGQKKGKGVLASHPAVDTLYQEADAFTSAMEADNAIRSVEKQAQRDTNKMAMEQALASTSVSNNIGGMSGGSHKSQHIRYMLGHLKERQKGYKRPFEPFNPRLVSSSNRSAFLKRMEKEKEVVPKREAKNIVEEKVEVVEAPKKRGRKAKTAEVEAKVEVVAEAPKAPVSRNERIKQLSEEGLSTRKIADQMKSEGFKKVSASTISNVLRGKGVKGCGYDEHPEDFFF